MNTCVGWNCRVGRPPRETAAALCSPCRTRGWNSVLDLERLYVTLHGVLGKERRPISESVSGSVPRAVLPIRMDAWSTIEDIGSYAIDWEGSLRSYLDLYDPLTAVNHDHAVGRAFMLLRRHTALLLDGLAFAHEFTYDTVRLVERARIITGSDEGDTVLQDQCPYCAAMALVRMNGTDQVVCNRCGKSWSAEWFARVQA